ncbi:energy transducer TonB, partial [Leclercia adecarboxylata]
GSGGSGVGVGLSFPVGGSTSVADNSQADCDGDVYRVEPRYPEQAAAQNFSGRVTVSFNVKLNGRAADYEAAGDKPFFEETKRAVMRSCWPAGVRQNLVASYQNGKTATWLENALSSQP